MGSEQRRARPRAARAEHSIRGRARSWLFGVVVVVVLGAGGALAFADFLTRPTAAAGTIDVQSSMAGFSPSAIRVTAGDTVTLSWWTNDSAMHLDGGVHTMIAPGLGLYEELAADSRREVVWSVPDRPGTYDVYCDTCCGGKDSPQMHGTIVVSEA